jgi:putative peptidoglycan lipid II flippase
LLGAALGTILLPRSRYHASENHLEYSRLLDWGLRVTLLLAAPASLALGILAVPLIATLFFHGAFSADDVFRTREALAAYSVGLTGLILVKILAPGFYARQNVRTPVRIALISLTATQVMNVAFIGWLQHAGLALSIGLAACLNALMLYRGLRNLNIYEPQPGWGIFVLKLIVAMAIMGLALWFGMGTEKAGCKCASSTGQFIWLGWFHLAPPPISLHYGFLASVREISNAGRQRNQGKQP